MKADFSRDSYDPLKRYYRVLMQQGRVQMDSDWNEQAAILLHRLECLVTDLVGPGAGPADSFEVAASGSSRDFTVSKGRYYVGGVLIENDADLTFSKQPKVTGDPTELQANQAYLVYLDAWEELVISLQDPAMTDIALGGLDTTARTRIAWRVRAHSVAQVKECKSLEGDQIWKDILSSDRSRQSRNDGGPRARDRRNPRRRALHHPAPGTLSRTGEPALPRRNPRRRKGRRTQWRNLQLVARKRLRRRRRSRPLRGHPDPLQPWAGSSRHRDRRLGGGHRRHLADTAALPRHQGRYDRSDRNSRHQGPPPLINIDPSLHPILRRWDQKSGAENAGGLKLRGGAAIVREGTGEKNWLALEDGIEIQFRPGIRRRSDLPPRRLSGSSPHAPQTAARCSGRSTTAGKPLPAATQGNSSPLRTARDAKLRRHWEPRKVRLPTASTAYVSVKIWSAQIAAR